MAFKMNGSPAKMGTISGTAGHSSALKMKAEENAASALKQTIDGVNQKTSLSGKISALGNTLLGDGSYAENKAAERAAGNVSDATKSANADAKAYKKMKTEKDAKAKEAKKGAKSYSEAYKDADKSKYKTEAEFIKAAKDYNKEKYGTEEPTKESKKLVGKYEGDMTTSPKVTKKTAKKELAARNKTKKVEAAKLEESKKQNEADVESGKAKKIVSPVTGDEAIDYRKPLPETKKRTKAGKLGVQFGNIFRKKNKKKNPHRKVIKT